MRRELAAARVRKCVAAALFYLGVFALMIALRVIGVLFRLL